MKRIALASLLALFALGAFAQAAPKRISVVGAGSVPMTVDYVSVDYSIAVLDADFGKAQDAATAASARTIAMLEAKFAVSERDMKTYSYSVTEKTVDAAGGPKSAGFEAAYSATLKVRALGDLTVILRALRETGVTSIGGIRFGVDDASKYEAEAIKKAFANAEDKAKAVAAAAKRKLKGAVSVTVIEPYGPPPGGLAQFSAGFAPALGDSGAILASDQTYRCTVAVDFEME